LYEVHANTSNPCHVVPSFKIYPALLKITARQRLRRKKSIAIRSEGAVMAMNYRKGVVVFTSRGEAVVLCAVAMETDSSSRSATYMKVFKAARSDRNAFA
jgi:hypothetical protein